MNEIRKSAIAGSWYPGRPDVLRADIERYLDKATIEPVQGAITSIVVPHAGYMYSGAIAAHAYKLLKGRVFDSVVVVGPSHRLPFQGASVYAAGGFETPLGVVPVDEALARKIMAANPLIREFPPAHSQEHSVEIQLPFLQIALGSFSFVPIVMGSQDDETCRILAEAISNATSGSNILVVGSSDLSHFHGYEEAVRLDARVLRHLEKMDYRSLLSDLDSGDCEACGGGPMAVAILAAQKIGAHGSKMLRYANSGDVTGDRGSVVGYAAAVFYKEGEIRDVETQGKVGVDMGLTVAEQKRLLAIARASIVSSLAGKEEPSFDNESGALREKRGAFVTLKKRGHLRGCIGFIEAKKPLDRTVFEMARAAAFEDPRFSPLKESELKDLAIEISVLTPFEKIRGPKEIEIGRDGLYIVKGYRSGLLLPQVAAEYEWDGLTFVEETCRKAGLSSDAWKSPEATLYRFSAQVFGDEI
ncbi:MAG: AmmeMemoRadiSam system protein B [Deltaproteobacteria bacterium]|nr:AmmeMemoRadiSam system protein B [Deltaproteobacteria bacterium]